MIVFAPCKINLGLYITEKRNDGYHNIQTIFYSIALYDILEIIDAQSFEFSITGTDKPINDDSNLCIKAIHLLIEKKYFTDFPKIHLHLHKNIPMGAGLGGGSSNATSTLSMLNEYFQLGIEKKTLLQLAAQLGSDCPFFIEKNPCFATGKGEILQPINLDLSNYTIILVQPNIPVSTAWAYQHITPQKPTYDLLQSIQLPLQQWKQTINNDFEIPIFHQFPELLDIKNELYHIGAFYAAMSGSGSTLFGIFEKNKKINLNFSKDTYKIFVI